MILENVELSYQNVSFGPDSGRIYSIDHESDILVVKTYPGGTLIGTYPLSHNLRNEVLSLDYDGRYFWTLSYLGSDGTLGRVINKWYFNGISLVKQIGIGNEINLLNGGAITYESEAMTVQRFITSFSLFADAGDYSVTLNNTELLEANDVMYLGPSTADPGATEEIEVLSVVGNTVTFKTPLLYDYQSNNQATYRKNIWLFNNYNGQDSTGGSLIQVHSRYGYIVSSWTDCMWKHVTAATTKSDGSLVYVRGPQAFIYKPFGVNSGLQTSFILTNIKTDNTTVLKVYDLAIDASSILKLQKDRMYFDTGSEGFIYVAWSDYNIDREFLASKVFSLTAKRGKSILFGDNLTSEFVVKVLDQYNIPVFSRTVLISENDVSGYIPAGYESFITDAQGEGVSRYNTGIAPDFNLLTIKMQDQVSLYNNTMNLFQLPYEENFSYIYQRGDTVNHTLITQYLQDFFTLLYQDEGFASELAMYQYELRDYDFSLLQRIPQAKAELLQTDLISSDMSLYQRIEVEDFTEIQQFDFLIFALPVPYSIKNPVDTNILIRIVGFGGIPLDPGTLVFKVNGVDRASDVVITSFGAGLQLEYDPAVNFDYFSNVTVEIIILDTAFPPNVLSTMYTFETVADYKLPFVDYVFPPDLSVGNDPETDVYVIVKDNETGINPESIRFSINGRFVSGVEVNEILPGAFRVLYRTTEPYIAQSIVSASVDVEDNAGNRFIGSWSFGIGDSDGIFFTNRNPHDCQKLVALDTDVCIEAYGKEDGIHLPSMEFDFDGRRVSVAVVPKIYRKE